MLGIILLKNGYDVKFVSTYDYDLIINDKKVDVKTKRTTVEPKEEYNCSISNSNIKQETDYYFFTRVHENKEICYLLGYIKKKRFFKKATFSKKGEPDGQWFFKDDCYNLEIKYLRKFK